MHILIFQWGVFSSDSTSHFHSILLIFLDIWKHYQMIWNLIYSDIIDWYRNAIINGADTKMVQTLFMTTVETFYKYMNVTRENNIMGTFLLTFWF